MIAIIAFASVAVACALLSPVVVARRWAFIGEGIGHSGFGGAGTAWLLMATLPATFDREWMPTVGVALFGLLAAFAIGAIARRGPVSGDVAIGIVLVATVAWGFVGQHVYRTLRHAEPAGFQTLFFGQPAQVRPEFALAALSVAIATAVALVGLRKEVLAYCLDPLLAEVSGVRAGLIHHLLIALVAIATIVGLQVVGTLLITALLVLPAATAQLVSKRLDVVVATSVACGMFSALGGYALNAAWPLVPVGPAIVLALFACFLAALATSRLKTV